jgi:hypothetical protein
MANLNEINPAVLADWMENFANESENIFQIFQTNSIPFSKEIYLTLSNNNHNNIRLYFGLTDEGIPKIIAVAAYFLNSGDNNINGYTDLIVEGKIFELYSNSVINFETAKSYIDNWKQNLNSNLFKFGFLLPRPCLVKLYEEDNLDQIHIYFGIIDREIKLIMQKFNPLSTDVAFDSALPCPSNCSLDTRLID